MYSDSRGDSESSGQDSRGPPVRDAGEFERLGDAALASGDFKEALESYEKALAIDPELIAAWYNRGLTLQQLGREGAAQRSFGEALRLRKRP